MGAPAAGVSLRPATAADFVAIRRLIRQVHINPTGLDWRHFVVAVDADGMLLGCGQLKPHQGDIVELASIAVIPAQRGRGIARLIIERLLALAPRPVFLTCRARLGPFYERWGFRSLEIPEMPRYFRRLARAMSVVGALFMPDDRLLVMALK